MRAHRWRRIALAVAAVLVVIAVAGVAIVVGGGTVPPKVTPTHASTTAP